MTTRAQHRSPNSRYPAHMIDEQLVSTRAVRPYCKRRIDVTAIIYQSDFGRLVNAEHFFKERVGKLFRVRFRKTDAEPIVEVCLRAVRRKIEAELVDAKRARAGQYRLARRDMTQKLRGDAHLTRNCRQVLTFFFYQRRGRFFHRVPHLLVTTLAEDLR